MYCKLATAILLLNAAVVNIGAFALPAPNGVIAPGYHHEEHHDWHHYDDGHDHYHGWDHRNSWHGGVFDNGDGVNGNGHKGHWAGRDVSQGTVFAHGAGKSWSTVHQLIRRDVYDHPNTWHAGVTVDEHGNGANWQGGYWNGRKISQGTVFKHGHGKSWNKVHDDLRRRDQSNTWSGGVATDGHGNGVNWQGGHWNGRDISQGTAFKNGHGKSWNYVDEKYKTSKDDGHYERGYDNRYDHDHGHNDKEY
jgi:hypothetical protein